MASSGLIFGLREFPRPRGHGFLFYKKPPANRETELVAFNLNEESAVELKQKFIQGIEEFIRREGFTPEEAGKALSNYETENMRDWAIATFAESAQEMIDRVNP
jgi:hypothetical protein